MSRKYFGTDGVRGEVGKFPITPEFVMKLGYAAGRVLVNHDQDSRPTVLIGKDTRISGYMLEAALQAGFTAAGVNVLLTGPLPTPGIAYLTRALRLEAGVVISASHNPFQDNGIKFFAEGGNKLDDALELEIEAMLDQPMATNPSLELGRARRIDGAAERYIEFCKSTFPNELSLKGLKLVVDCANGATYHIAPKVFHELGAELVEIGCEPNGYNINDKVGATYPKTLQMAVLEHQADFGIALDGDGDRLIMVDAAGRVYDGDQLIYVIAKARAARGELKGGVVGTVMTNMAMELALQKQGVPFGRAKVGDRYVLEMLHADGWQVGGEASGHILCLDKHSTGDGIISSLQVLASLKQLGLSLAEICADWRPFPQTLINVRHNGCDWKAASAAPLAEAEAALQGRGRVVLRPSGTEPVVRVMVEADDKALADTWAKAIAAAIEKVSA
ncbi:phosphoglucosamine mutase [Chromobacterium violaceum]|uniref:Phosphoglucosamine mutase n=2 Tax=Chromobacterium violaceum TaxID=536 RepID=GLMM_CHRVO|nr:phosphoglucosamine mutase [Chromobacterium violaceum]Q7NRI6.1 RecName: Full=Phosphoglucosamine mutase [Chromobacterium violaceum ATCC 12472]AAQ61457.1 phosphoglucosamine mutase [Chromobacterium violaceum ATCC 12472]MBA8734698.1 phosphoglucosamine mutase [Chromobacterium violaceum]MBP4043554.1 phosphoglucosamine mutase [Chromobacterium violaceum]OLZ79234.1 phosphoglucosamine mutase [Chromobacterium violaceum]OQS29498.1 phosphoglucosamine mutase [Chromobacterium violaceum]